MIQHQSAGGRWQNKFTANVNESDFLHPGQFLGFYWQILGGTRIKCILSLPFTKVPELDLVWIFLAKSTTAALYYFTD